MDREKDIQEIEAECGKPRGAVSLCDVLIAINNRVPSPMSFGYYINLVAHDADPHWDLEKDTLEAQSGRCVAWVVEALNRKF